MDVEGLDNIYKVSSRTKDYVNPTADGNLSWCSINSRSSDSNEGLENWQQRPHEVSMRRCARITKSLCWIGTKICKLPHYDGLTDATTFFFKFQDIVVEQQRLLALDVSLKETYARWWVAHKISIQDWSQCKRLMQIRFGKTSKFIADKYTNTISYKTRTISLEGEL